MSNGKDIRREPTMADYRAIVILSEKCWDEFSVELDFDTEDREKLIREWVAFRTLWRKVYKGLSADIRALKSERKGHRNGYVPGLYDAQARARWMMLLRNEAKRQFIAAITSLKEAA